MNATIDAGQRGIYDLDMPQETPLNLTEPFYSTAQAGEILGISDERIREHMKDLDIKRRFVGRNLVLLASEVRRIHEYRQRNIR